MTWLVAAIAWAFALPLAAGQPPVARAWVAHGTAPYFAGGALAGLFGAAVGARYAPMLLVLEHELTHLLMAVVLLRRPMGLRAGGGGGEVVYSGRGSTLIRLAPYFLPTLALPCLALAPFLQAGYRTGLVTIVGVTWGYHAWTTAAETRPHQPDLRKGGLVASTPALIGDREASPPAPP